MDTRRDAPSPEKATKKIKKIANPHEYPDDPKVEGLRPGMRYAGGDPDEIIVIDQKKYRKKPLFSAKGLDDGIAREEGSATEAEYYSHAGPGWDGRSGYSEELLSADGTREHHFGGRIFDPEILSNLILYKLVEA